MFGRKNNHTTIRHKKVTVHIFDSVLQRIRNTVARSNIEEGGKLLGKINQSGQDVDIIVETYIDSGPGVSNSVTHLYPDGPYQEDVFRVIERLDPDIEHLGSWHSHHCNGLPHLSGGDINGYKSCVNNPNYNVDYFLALLVTDLHRGRLNAKYYLFIRHDAQYYELDSPNIQVIRDKFPLESTLKNLEENAFANRHDSQSSEPYSQRRVQSTALTDDSFNKIRAQDKQWLSSRVGFDSVKATRSRKDGAISWWWSLFLPDNNKLDVSYKYLSNENQDIGARLSIGYQGKQLVEAEIDLDDFRFQKIEKHLNDATEKVKGD